MPYVTCSICGKAGIQSLDIDMCFKCIERGNKDTKLLAIRKYLEKHPDAKYYEVSRILHIDTELMDEFIEDGSLQLISKQIEEEQAVKSKKDERARLIRELSEGITQPIPKKQKNKKIYDSKLLEDLDELKSEHKEIDR